MSLSLQAKEKKKADKAKKLAEEAAQKAEKNRLEQEQIAADIAQRLNDSKSASDPGAKLLVWIKDPPFKCESTDLKVSCKTRLLGQREQSSGKRLLRLMIDCVLLPDFRDK